MTQCDKQWYQFGKFDSTFGDFFFYLDFLEPKEAFLKTILNILYIAIF